MRLICVILLTGVFSSCYPNNKHFLNCKNEKELFTLDNVYSLSLDTIMSYKEFRDFAIKVADTISSCHSVYGFLYNYADSSVIPNMDSTKNVLIPCFNVFSNHCFFDKALPSELNILILPQDSLLLVFQKDTTILNISQDKEKVYKYFSDYYIKKYYDTAKYSGLIGSWTHIFIYDTLNFKESFQTVFNIVFKAYCESVRSSIKRNFNQELCELESREFDKLINSLHFRIVVNDYDIRIHDYKGELEIEMQKEEKSIYLKDN